MPIIVDPAAPNPLPLEKITSPDGLLTGYRLQDGVLLIADWSVQSGPTEQIIATNIYPDPSHEYSGGWFSSSNSNRTIERVTEQPHSGTYSIKMVNLSGGSRYASMSTSTAADLGFETGDTVAFSGYAYQPAASSGPSARLVLSGDAIAATTAGEVSTVGAWQQVAAQTTITDASQTLYLSAYTPDDAGGMVYWDDLGLAHEPVGFSGDTADTDQDFYRWIGDPGSSPSGHYIVQDVTTWPDGLDQVRFIRNDTEPVRSGNDAWAVGGQAIAYDMEAPLDHVSSWVAIPIYRDGTVGNPTEAIGLVTTKPDEPYNSWLKSIAQPHLSMRVFVTQDSMPSWSYTSRTNLSQIQGSQYPAGGWDVPLAAELTLSAYTDPDVDQHQMLALLTSGPLLFQTDPDFDELDFYALPGDITRDLAGTMANGARKWTIPLTTIGRPSPFGAPLYIPGHTYADTEQGTYARRQSVFPAFADATGIPA